MAKLTKTIYLTWATSGERSAYAVSDVDLSILNHHTAVSRAEVEFDIGDFDGRPVEIQHLEAELESVRANSQMQINLLLDRISNLRAIWWEAGE